MKWSPTKEVLDLLNKFSLSEPQKCLEESVENMSPNLIKGCKESCTLLRKQAKKGRKNRKEDSIAIFFFGKVQRAQFKERNHILVALLV